MKRGLEFFLASVLLSGCSLRMEKNYRAGSEEVRWGDYERNIEKEYAVVPLLSVGFGHGSGEKFEEREKKEQRDY